MPAVLNAAGAHGCPHALAGSIPVRFPFSKGKRFHPPLRHLPSARGRWTGKILSGSLSAFPNAQAFIRTTAMPTSVYLCGSSCRSAQGSSRSSLSAQPFRPPSARTAQALGQQRSLPYFAAFDTELLTLPQLCVLLETEILAAAADAGWTEAELAHIPLFVGSTSYVMSDREARQTRHGADTRYGLGQIAGYLKQRFRSPEVFSFATSCTASAQALLAAAQTLAGGFAGRALVLGFESFNRLTFEHFHAMHLLADTPRLPCGQASGMVLGEAAACLALAVQPPPAPCLRLYGAVGQTDSGSLTASSAPALRRLIETCLHQAGLTPASIAAVKAHGSGGSSDAVETEVLHALLPHAPLILFKPYTGHTLGATAALETALLHQAARHGLPALPAGDAVSLPHLHGKTLPAAPCLNYFLGFGGSHCAWISEWQPAAAAPAA